MRFLVAVLCVTAALCLAGVAVASPNSPIPRAPDASAAVMASRKTVSNSAVTGKGVPAAAFSRESSLEGRKRLKRASISSNSRRTR